VRALPSFGTGGVVLTREDYLDLPEDDENSPDYEIIFGVLDVAPRPRLRHQRIAYELGMELTSHTRATGLGGEVIPDVDLMIDHLHTYVSPDLMYFTAEQVAELDPDKQIELMPTLVVEVLSPSTSRRDLIRKRQAYAHAGIRHYWVFDYPRKRVLELTLQPSIAEYAERVVRAPEPFRPTLFAGLSIDLVELFT
jgi:Uma2 family endonuclease